MNTEDDQGGLNGSQFSRSVWRAAGRRAPDEGACTPKRANEQEGKRLRNSSNGLFTFFALYFSHAVQTSSPGASIAIYTDFKINKSDRLLFDQTAPFRTTTARLPSIVNRRERERGRMTNVRSSTDVVAEGSKIYMFGVSYGVRVLCEGGLLGV